MKQLIRKATVMTLASTRSAGRLYTTYFPLMGLDTADRIARRIAGVVGLAFPFALALVTRKPPHGAAALVGLGAVGLACYRVMAAQTKMETHIRAAFGWDSARQALMDPELEEEGLAALAVMEGYQPPYPEYLEYAEKTIPAAKA